MLYLMVVCMWIWRPFLCHRVVVEMTTVQLCGVLCQRVDEKSFGSVGVVVRQHVVNGWTVETALDTGEFTRYHVDTLETVLVRWCYLVICLSWLVVPDVCLGWLVIVPWAMSLLACGTMWSTLVGLWFLEVGSWYPEVSVQTLDDGWNRYVHLSKKSGLPNWWISAHIMSPSV